MTIFYEHVYLHTDGSTKFDIVKRDNKERVKILPLNFEGFLMWYKNLGVFKADQVP